MESGSVEDIYRNPGHPYLKALLNAVPRFAPRRGRAPRPAARDQGGDRRADQARRRPRAPGRRRHAAPQGGRNLQGIPDPQGQLFRLPGRALGPRRRRCQLRNRTGRMPRPRG
ncbi:MAG: hypothetical protein VW453_12445 [Rhodospirillaceae bacterium]